LLAMETGAIGHFWSIEEEIRRLEELSLAVRSLSDPSALDTLSRPGPALLKRDARRMNRGRHDPPISV